MVQVSDGNDCLDDDVEDDADAPEVDEVDDFGTVGIQMCFSCFDSTFTLDFYHFYLN